MRPWLICAVALLAVQAIAAERNPALGRFVAITDAEGSSERLDVGPLRLTCGA